MTAHPQLLNASLMLHLRAMRGLERPDPLAHRALQNRPLFSDPSILPNSHFAPQIDSTLRGCVTLLVETVHEAQRNAGWWSDPATGKDIERNIAELLALVCTEIIEAQEGWLAKCQDDKLPASLMHEVEIADALIRAFDLAAVYAPNLAEAITAQAWEFEANVALLIHPLNGVTPLIQAVEAARKSKPIDNKIAEFILWAYRHAAAHRLDVSHALVEKFTYNQSRADHTLAARREAGGKKF